MSDILKFPDAMERQGYTRIEIRPTRKKSPAKPYGDASKRCKGGCGKKAEWPRDGQPVFCTILCGYRLAVSMFRRKKA